MNLYLRSGRARYPGRVLLYKQSSTSTILRRHFFSAPWCCAASPSRAPRTKRWDPDRDSKNWPPLVHSKSWKNSGQWLQYIERYLPPELRRDPNNSLPAEGNESLQCRVITRVLQDARVLGGHDLLTLLGTEYGKWDTAYRIMEKLLDYAHSKRSALEPGRLPSNLDWGSCGTLDSIASGRQKSKPLPPVLPSDAYPALDWYDKYAEDLAVSNRMGEDRSEFGIMEEIWQSLGGMVIEAADLPAEESRSVMSYFYRTVARLHHQNCIPHSVYTYVPNEDAGSSNRPPTMHILSSHIMNVLSDAVWMAQEAESAAKAIATGEERPVTRFKMRVRELGPEIWLDFVLWCCVEGGFSKEGVRILKRLQERENKWFTKSWASVLSPSERIDLAAVDRYETWASCVEPSSNGTNGKHSTLFRGMGERTISSDVVSALIDGLFTFARLGVAYRGDKIEYILSLINSIAPLLRETGIYSSSNKVDALIVRILESKGLVLEVAPRAADLVLDVVFQISNRESDTAPRNGSSGSSSLVLGLYQYIMDIYAANGRASDAIDVFHKLRPALSTTNVQAVQPPKGGDGETRQEGFNESSTSQFTGGQRELGASVSLTTRFSNVSLALLLDIATTSEDFRFAYELFLSPTPIITTGLLQDPVIASAALRSIAATGATHLLTAVHDQVGRPLPTSVLKALIDYTISNHEWADAEQFLLYLRDTRTSHWAISNVTNAAATIVRLEGSEWNKTSRNPPSGFLKRPFSFLTLLLEGRFNLQREYYQIPSPHQEAILHTLGKIFTSTPGVLSHLRPHKNFWNKNSRVPLRFIPGFAFNYFLSAIVDTRGSVAGKGLWERWCLDPLNMEAQRITPGGNSLLYFADEMDSRVGYGEPMFDDVWFYDQASKLVRPNVTTLRLIAQAALRELDDLKNGVEPVYGDVTEETSSEVLSWTKRVFRRFRFTQEEIDHEMSECLRRVQEKKEERRHL